MNPSLDERSGVVALGDMSTATPVIGVGQSGDELLVSTILSPAFVQSVENQLKNQLKIS